MLLTCRGWGGGGGGELENMDRFCLSSPRAAPAAEGGSRGGLTTNLSSMATTPK